MAISSLTNSTVRRVRRLRKRAWRERRGMVLLEGKRTVTGALEAGAVLPDLLHTSGAALGGELLDRAKRAGTRIHEVTDEVMAHLTDTASAPSMLAVGPLVEASLDAVAGSSAMILEAVHDPATLGGLLAAAAAAGMPSVVVANGCADPFAPKVMRAAGGAHYVLRVARGVNADAARARLDAGSRLVALVSDGPAPWNVDLRGPLVLQVGGTGNGEKVGVPVTAGLAPPLTAAAAVVLYEWVRQGGDAR